MQKLYHKTWKEKIRGNAELIIYPSSDHRGVVACQAQFVSEPHPIDLAYHKRVKNVKIGLWNVEKIPKI